MGARALAFTLLLLAGCNAEIDDNAVPADADIERLEERLSQHPCVGNLDQWERNYRFSRKSGLFSPYSLQPDLDVVELHLRRVGTVSVKPGKHIWMPRHGGDWRDSKPARSLDGRFSLGDDKLVLSGCKPIADR